MDMRKTCMPIAVRSKQETLSPSFVNATLDHTPFQLTFFLILEKI
uniref:Uncharacterized protein n=1 Tax=Anguilla anguilla TaxID=7936 RepID=A0A0E9Q524_ANGAN